MDEKDKFYSRYDRLVNLVKQRPGISKTELTLATKSFKSCEREKLLDAMIDDGYVEEQITDTGRRPRINYWPHNHPASPRIILLAQEVGNDPDTSQMTNEQIKSFNERRREFNEHLARMGCYPLEMLPEHDLPILA